KPKVFLSIEYNHIPINIIPSFFQTTETRIVGALAKDEKWCEAWRASISAPISSYDECLTTKSITIEAVDIYHCLLKFVLSDNRLYFLLERRFRDNVDRSTFNSLVDVEKIVTNVIN